MRKISLLLLFFIATNVSAQKNGSVDSLYNDFANAYLSALDSVQHFRAMLDATDWALRPENPHYRAVWKLYSQKFKIHNEDTLMYRISDTIFKYFHERDMWNKHASIKLKYATVITNYSEGICPCITKKFESMKSLHPVEVRRRFNFHTEIRICETELSQNKEVLAKINQGLQQVAPADQAPLQTAILLFFYDNCPSFKKFMVTGFQEEAVEIGNIYVYRLTENIGERITSLYKRKSFDSLHALFPDYVKYSKQMELFGKSVPRDFNTLFDGNDRNELLKRDTITYHKDQTLFGQKILSYSVADLEMKVLSFEYIPADKIKNRKLLLARIKEMGESMDEPPPPQVPVRRDQ